MLGTKTIGVEPNFAAFAQTRSCGAARSSYSSAVMSRLRAILATLLTLTWCSVAWHAELEAAGLMLEHAHHGSGATGAAEHEHSSLPPDAHDPLLVRDLGKDGEIRVSAAPLLLALLGLFAVLGAARSPADLRREPIPIRGETAPPFQKIWQFVQRCAPEPAAPPALS